MALTVLRVGFDAELAVVVQLRAYLNTHAGLEEGSRIGPSCDHVCASICTFHNLKVVEVIAVIAKCLLLHKRSQTGLFASCHRQPTLRRASPTNDIPSGEGLLFVQRPTPLRQNVVEIAKFQVLHVPTVNIDTLLGCNFLIILGRHVIGRRSLYREV